MLSKETGKRRSRRIPLDYHRRIEFLGKLRRTLSMALTVLTLLWLCGFEPDVRRWSRLGETSRQRASHGPLTRPHSNWETACDECHVPFQPIDGSSWVASFGSNPRASDAKCSACHPGPKHSPAEIDAEVSSCASCHRDHQGRNNSLLAMGDAQCTRCHAELAPHLKPGAAMTVAATVTRFEDDPRSHPEFALFLPGKSTDPGTIKFNHKLHMTPGLNSELSGKPLLTPADLPDADRSRYTTKGGSLSDPIRLSCDSCHQPSGERRGRPIEGGQGGARMKPISYDRDCRACHLLSYDPALPPVRHGLQPPDVSETIWQAYSGRHVKTRRQVTALAGSSGSRTTLPGLEEDPETPELHDLIRKEVNRAERILFGDKRCGECHTIDRSTSMARSPEHSEDLGHSLKIQAASIPHVWFRRASFDHGAHRASQCRDCHSRAYPETTEASKVSADLLIPSISNCLQCHNPRPTGREASGAGHSCTQCHPYHDGRPGARSGSLHQPETFAIDGRATSEPAPIGGRLIDDLLQRAATSTGFSR